MKQLTQTILGVAGVGCLVAAAWRLDMIAGLAALGVALLFIDWRIDQ